MICLLYVSYSLLDLEIAESAVDDIVRQSIVRNSASDITGALLFTGVNFAQFLEGPEGAVTDLMNSIRRDARHRAVWVVLQKRARERRFGNWSMAYGGRSVFVSRHIEELLSTSSAKRRAQASEQLIEMMVEFAK